MSKINGKIAVFTVFLVLVVVYGYMQAPTNREVKIDSFLIQFENGTT